MLEDIITTSRRRQYLIYRGSLHNDVTLRLQEKNNVYKHRQSLDMLLREMRGALRKIDKSILIGKYFECTFLDHWQSIINQEAMEISIVLHTLTMYQFSAL